MTPAGNPACVIYQWLSEAGYFIHAVLPHARQLAARIQDTAAEVLDAVPVGTDIFAFHLNCTLTSGFPVERNALVRALRARGIRVLNADVIDTSKRRVQAVCASLGLHTTLASRDGDPDEVIIVKTDLNFGGDSEWALFDEERAALGIGKGSDIIWTPSDYRVLPRKDVQEIWWADDRLVCERFVTNAHERWYRAFLFLDRLVVCELENPNEIKKVGDMTVSAVWIAPENDFVAGLMRDLDRFAREMALDFGTIDAVADDEGRSYIIDVNTTPVYNFSIPGVIEHVRAARIL